MLFSFIFLACSENVLVEKITLEPNIQVVPNSIEFPDTSVLNGEISSEIFWIINSGNDTLSVSLDEDSDIFSFSEYSFEIEPQEEYEVEAYFQPDYFYEYNYFAFANSNDPDDPRVSIKLSGLGLSPGIDVSSFLFNFETNIGCEDIHSFVVQNIGNDTLIIDNILNYESALSDISIDVDIANNGNFPWEIEPSEYKLFYGKYNPLDMVDDYNKVLIPHNDPYIVDDEEVEIYGKGLLLDEYSQKFRPSTIGLLDLIFVVDDSGSMNGFQSQMLNNISNVTSIFYNASIDYRIGVITTTSSDFVGSVIDPSTHNPAHVLYNNFDDIGISGSGTEKGLQELAEAVTVGEAASSGFIREDATLAIIFLSDEKDNSPGNWSTYANSVEGIKASKSMITSISIVGDHPNGCLFNNRSIEFGEGYYEFTNYFSGTNISICSDWGSQINNIMWVLTYDDTFELDYVPVLDTIEVYKDGVMLGSSDWTYNSLDNTVTISNIDRDSEVEIRYYPMDCQ